MPSLTIPSTNILEEKTIFCNFPLGDLTILKGFPNIGKTTYTTSLALSLAQSQRNSIYFSLTRNSTWLIERMKCQAGETMYQELKERITIDDTCVISISEIRSRLDKTPATHVFVDGLQWLSVPPCTSRKAEIELILQELKSIAVEYNVAVIAIYQISKGLRSLRNAVVDVLVVNIEGVHIYLLEEVDKPHGGETSDIPQVRVTRPQAQVLEIQALPKSTQETDSTGSRFELTDLQRRVLDTGIRAQQMIADSKSSNI